MSIPKLWNFCMLAENRQKKDSKLGVELHIINPDSPLKNERHSVTKNYSYHI